MTKAKIATGIPCIDNTPDLGVTDAFAHSVTHSFTPSAAPHPDHNRVRCIHDPYTTRYKLQECDYTGNWIDLPCKHFVAVKDALEYFHIVKRIKKEIPADIGSWTD